MLTFNLSLKYSLITLRMRYTNTVVLLKMLKVWKTAYRMVGGGPETEVEWPYENSDIYKGYIFNM